MRIKPILSTVLSVILLLAITATAHSKITLADRVNETTTTSGLTTPVELLGAVFGWQSFVEGIGDTNTTYYCIAHKTISEWEVGVGTVSDETSPTNDTLTRTIILSSSSSGAMVTFSAGVKNVYCVNPTGGAITIQEDGASGDFFRLSHNGTNNLFETNAGAFVFTVDAASIPNSSVQVHVKGSGTGYGKLYVYDQDEAEYLATYAISGEGYLSTLGASPSYLHLQNGAHADIRVFHGCATGENRSFAVYGYDVGASARKAVNYWVDTDGSGVVAATAGENLALRPNASSTEGIVLQSSGTTHALGTVEVDAEIVLNDMTTAPTVAAGDVAAANVGGDFQITTDSDKTLVLSNPAWDDLRVNLLAAKVPAAGGPGFAKAFDNGSGSTGVFCYWFDASSVEQLYFIAQMPHGLKLDDPYTDIEPHIHWIADVSGTALQTVSWGLEYTWQDIGGNFGNTSIIYTDVHYPADASIVADRHYISDFPAINDAGAGVSSVLICRLFRDATGGGGTDDFTGDTGSLYFDFHIPIDTLGSRTELAK